MLGELKKAESYYKLTLKYKDDGPTIYYVLAELYEQMDQKSLSLSYFNSCYKLALKSNDREMLEVLQTKGIKG